MTLEELKEKLDTNTLDTDSFIFVVEEDNSFLVKQYYKKIAELLHFEIEYVDTPPRKSIVPVKNNILFIYSCDSWDKPPMENTCIITKKSEFGIKFPKLENWMVADYAKSVCAGVSYTDDICKFCNYDINKVDNELQKLLCFPEQQRNQIYKNLLNEGNYVEVSKTALDLTSAIIDGNYNEIKLMLLNKDTCDLTTFFVLTTLHNKLETLLKIKTLKNPTLKESGCSSDKQLAYLKNYVQKFSAATLLEMFCTISEVDYLIRGSGVLNDSMVLDYLITRLISIRERKR